jgi:hypothetical protein
VHGVFKNLNKTRGRQAVEDDTEPKFFDQASSTSCARGRSRRALPRRRRREAVRHGAEEHLHHDHADHGELFGEAGYFGHGPINHEKVYEVPSSRQDSLTPHHAAPSSAPIAKASSTCRQRFHAVVHRLSGAGKSTLANHVEKTLKQRGMRTRSWTAT